MTLPDERYRAVITAERLLKDLCDPSVTPRVPKSVRQRASHCLRHYPGQYDMQRAAAQAPDVFIPHLDPLYKMVKRHDMRDRIQEDVEQDLREAKENGKI
jgi:hypothetical protein